MVSQDELAQLEAERDRLLSMIAYQERMARPNWSSLVALGVLVGMGIIVVEVVSDGQTSLYGLPWAIVIVGLAAYVLTQKFRMFGMEISVIKIIDLAHGGRPPVPVGEFEARQHLANCEARIMELKEGRS
jgi:hypothetical protein